MNASTHQLVLPTAFDGAFVGWAGVDTSQVAGKFGAAGISGMAGNAAVRTGDAETGLEPIFDAAVRQEIDAQVAITAAFGQQASRAVGDYAAEQILLRNKKLAKAKDATGDKKAQLEQEAKELNDNWGDTGTLRLLAHTIIGGLTGGLDGTLGAAAGTLAAPTVAQTLADAGITGGLASTITALASTAAGAIAGGGLNGGATAFNEVTNNYLTHTQILARDKAIKLCKANSNTACEIKTQADYDLISAKKSATINYGSVLSESSLQAEKAELQKQANDPSLSAESRQQVQRSIRELDVAINSIQKSPVLKDAAVLGLVLADVILLDKLAVAKTLTSALVRDYVLKQTGKEITPDAAAVIANNFYREGAAVEFGSSRLITNPNEAVFWSGRTDGVGGIEAAKQIANQYQGRTLEQLLESRQISMPIYDPNILASVRAWQDVSTELAKNASGEVRATLGSQMRPQSIWEVYEFPELIRNPAVTKVIAIDPKTGVQRILFERGTK